MNNIARKMSCHKATTLDAASTATIHATPKLMTSELLHPRTKPDDSQPTLGHLKRSILRRSTMSTEKIPSTKPKAQNPVWNLPPPTPPPAIGSAGTAIPCVTLYMHDFVQNQSSPHFRHRVDRCSSASSRSSTRYPTSHPTESLYSFGLLEQTKNISDLLLAASFSKTISGTTAPPTIFAMCHRTDTEVTSRSCLQAKPQSFRRTASSLYRNNPRWSAIYGPNQRTQAYQSQRVNVGLSVRLTKNPPLTEVYEPRAGDLVVV